MLTGPSNRGRDDLRCPMGCRMKRAREERSRLSREYYKTPEGRAKKQELNKNRKGSGGPASEESPTPNNNDADLESYLKSIVSVIEGRAVDDSEVQSLIERSRDKLRQYGLGKEEKVRKKSSD